MSKTYESITLFRKQNPQMIMISKSYGLIKAFGGHFNSV